MVIEARHVETAPSTSAQPWTRVDLDLYEVSRDDVIVGYVEVVGQVFVALVGTRYDRAEEVCQTLSFADAIDALPHSPAAA